ncbi:hypothetical protein JTE90_003938 [Oedothorax gibbosus]|uniref:Uncharacterized protein n=1 Tax=Oedothorax gibbosus TaxID=931172 RepID=A0AAV6UWC6_9ARAC|nr:hypothetical protein JTE90_003938 [Oedothorax gibbosus]
MAGGHFMGEICQHFTELLLFGLGNAVVYSRAETQIENSNTEETYVDVHWILSHLKLCLVSDRVIFNSSSSAHRLPITSCQDESSSGEELCEDLIGSFLRPLSR